MDYTVARISRITAYLVKGCAGTDLTYANLTKGGLNAFGFKDREFMVVMGEPDGEGVYHFVTQRDKRGEQTQGFADLVHVKPKPDDFTMRLTWDGQDEISVPSGFENEQHLRVKEHVEVLTAVDQGDDVAQWLSDHLHANLRLVRAAGLFKRTARQNYMQNNNPVCFPDGYPIHWFSEESLRELSEIAGYDIPSDTFRPNIIVEGVPPQYEHRIHEGRVAGVSFVDTKPCDRCPVTNVDQKTGKVMVGRALFPLSKYKNWTNRDGQRKVIFGEYMLPLGEGIIGIGDYLRTVSQRDPPLVYGARAA